MMTKEGAVTSDEALWYLYNDTWLSPVARTWIENAAASGEKVALSRITMAEMVSLVEKGRIDAVALTRVLAKQDAVDAVLVDIPFTRS